jgi:hypothetical protein
MLRCNIGLFIFAAGKKKGTGETHAFFPETCAGPGIRNVRTQGPATVDQ